MNTKKEIIIKSKKRVREHGEVFTPRHIVKQMCNLDGLKDVIFECTTNVLEPAVGEGVFLDEILMERLNRLYERFKTNLSLYENYSLLALTSLYGVELLRDNTQKCILNIYQRYFEYYQKISSENNAKMKNSVLESAKLIISNNIVQGNFLTRQTPNGDIIIFSEWKPINLKSNTKTIKIQRTEYSLDDIYKKAQYKGDDKKNLDNEAGFIYKYNQSPKIISDQLSLFDFAEVEKVEQNNSKKYRYTAVKITDLYKEEMEECCE